MCRYYEEDEVTPKAYQVPGMKFDVLAWRELCRGFLSYIENLDLTNSEQHLRHGLDEYILRGLHQVEVQGSELVRAATFLINARPPEDNLYISSICLGDIGRDEEEDDDPQNSDSEEETVSPDEPTGF